MQSGQGLEDRLAAETEAQGVPQKRQGYSASSCNWTLRGQVLWVISGESPPGPLDLCSLENRIFSAQPGKDAQLSPPPLRSFEKSRYLFSVAQPWPKHKIRLFQRTRVDLSLGHSMCPCVETNNLKKVCVCKVGRLGWSVGNWGLGGRGGHTGLWDWGWRI